MLAQSIAEYDLQLQRDVMDLASITSQLEHDLCFIYCQANLPTPQDEGKVVNPRRVYEDLSKDGYRWLVSRILSMYTETIYSWTDCLCEISAVIVLHVFCYLIAGLLTTLHTEM